MSTAATSTPFDPARAAIDVTGIGNALVDVLVHESDDKVDALGMIKGAMNLVDEDRSREIYGSVGPGVEISGGSVANSMVGVASLGGAAHYLGRVKDDQLGMVFAHDIRANGVGFHTELAPDGPSTGCCIILVTPDAQRTMNTYLGSSVHFGPSQVDVDLLGRTSILFLEGYLFDPPEAQEAFRFAAKVARDAGKKVAMTLSDSFCVERHREAFVDMVDNHIDILLANEHEICSLYEVDDLDAAMEIVRARCGTVAITRSSEGSTILSGDQTVHVAAEPVDEVVDTTGAGDLYAAGFLFGLARGHDLHTSGRLGSLAAAEVISHLGARPEVSLAELAAPILAESATA